MKLRLLTLLLALCLAVFSGCGAQEAAASSGAVSSGTASAETSEEDTQKQELQQQLEDVREQAAADGEESALPPDKTSAEFDQAAEDAQAAIEEELAS